MRFDLEPTVLMIQIGKNDSYVIDRTGNNYVPKSVFEKNLFQIYKKINNSYIDIVFLTLMTVNEDKVNPIPWVNEEDRSVSNQEIIKYNNIIRSVAHETSTDIIDQEKLWSQKDCSKFLDEDGLHPNSSRHKLIFQEAKKYLLNKYNF